MNGRESKSFLDTLADIASQTTPLKSALLQIKTESHENNNHQNRRPRAMSEPWIRGSTFSSLLSPTSSSLSFSSNSGGTTTSTVITLPQMLEKYSSIYNTNGRIGIYTREERDVIISRFHEKRKKRVWVKKIRYHCRKNLADNRIRVKGRFVRNTGADTSGTNPHDDEEEYDDEEDMDGDDSPSKSIKNTNLMTSDALSALLFVSERRLELERGLQADDNQSNGSGSTSTSTQYNPPHNNGGPKRKKLKLKFVLENRDTDEEKQRHERDGDGDQAPELDDGHDISPSPSLPTEEMSLIENVRSRKRMRRHSIAY